MRVRFGIEPVFVCLRIQQESVCTAVLTDDLGEEPSGIFTRRRTQTLQTDPMAT
jgi:hypothetical protein